MKPVIAWRCLPAGLVLAGPVRAGKPLILVCRLKMEGAKARESSSNRLPARSSSFERIEISDRRALCCKWRETGDGFITCVSAPHVLTGWRPWTRACRPDGCGLHFRGATGKQSSLAGLLHERRFRCRHA